MDVGAKGSGYHEAGVVHEENSPDRGYIMRRTISSAPEEIPERRALALPGSQWFLATMVFMLVAGMLVLAGCSDDPDRRTDPNERVSFHLSGDWEPVPGTNETRYRPSGEEQAGEGQALVEIQVNTDEPRSLEKLERERDVLLERVTGEGEKVLTSETREHNGFEVIDYAHTDGDAVTHYVLMTRGDFTVYSFLKAGSDEYERYLSLFRDVVNSIRAL